MLDATNLPECIPTKHSPQRLEIELNRVRYFLDLLNRILERDIVARRRLCPITAGNPGYRIDGAEAFQPHRMRA